MNNQIPRHIGFIVDGNRRWAGTKGLSINEGHRRGAKNLEIIAKACFALGIPSVTFYVFSTENWQRSKSEVNFLMNLFQKQIAKYIKEFNQENIAVNIIGEKDGLTGPIKKLIDNSRQNSIKAIKGNLNLALNYGGQDEIVSICQNLVKAGKKISRENIEKNLYLTSQPSVDLIIRTSGEIRLSGFLSWQSAYSELYFSKKYWPDFTSRDLQLALGEYSKRARRFGK